VDTSSLLAIAATTAAAQSLIEQWPELVAEHDHLSGAELRARLIQRDVPEDLAYQLVDGRDRSGVARKMITHILSDNVSEILVDELESFRYDD
jgi:hypothetical protein